MCTDTILKCHAHQNMPIQWWRSEHGKNKPEILSPFSMWEVNVTVGDKNWMKNLHTIDHTMKRHSQPKTTLCLRFHTILILSLILSSHCAWVCHGSHHIMQVMCVQSVDELKGFVNNRLMRASVITITDSLKTFFL